eukprot:gene6220-7204_t
MASRILEIRKFLDRHKGAKGFLWTPPLGELGLYKCNGYKPVHRGGQVYAITKLEPGAEIRLFEIDGTEYGADYLRFHGQAIPHTSEELLAYEHSEEELPAKSIWWQGEEYAAWPVQFEGVSSSSDGTAARPTFAAGNVNRRITALCLAFEDLAKFQLTIRETTAKYLDAVNFPNGNPTADPTQEALDIWYIDQKTVEDDTVVCLAAK